MLSLKSCHAGKRAGYGANLALLTGFHGFRPIPRVIMLSHIPITRALLAVTRDEAEAECQEQKQEQSNG